jgi:hypothetical protein
MLTVVRERWRELLLEGGAVLLGVLLAFAVDAYGESLSERTAERAYLVALADEVRANDELLQNLSDGSRSRIADVESYLTRVVHASPSERGSVEAVNEMLGQVGPFRVATFQQGALEDLLTSGGIELVRSAELRRAVLFYAQLLEQEMVRQEAALRFWEDHMAPYYYEHASFFDFMTWLEVPGEAIPGALDVDAFHGSHRYSNLIIERRVRDTSLLQTREALAEQIDVVLGMLPGGAL